LIKILYLRNKIRQYPFNILIAIAAIIGGYSLLLFMDYGLDHEHITTCPFKLVTGKPCPGCGMGRATLALFSGDIPASLYYNILCIPFTLFVLLSLVWLSRDLITGKNTFLPGMKKPVNNKWKIVIFGVIIIAWILNIWHGI